MKRKCLVIGIILLFILTSVIPSIASKPFHEKYILTVDDEPGLADYTSIRDALNHSNPGDTIEIYSGMYNENTLNITTRNLTLLGLPYDLPGGDDVGKPCVYNNESEKADYIFSIREKGVSIIGFKIWNIGPLGGSDNIIIIYSDNCLLTNNEFNNISDIHGNIQHGIMLSAGNHSLISHNTFSQCGYSIYIHGNNNTVDGNLMNLTGLGITVTGEHHRISNNTIVSPRQYGIRLGSSFYNNITGNNIIGGDWGIFFEHVNSYNTVFRNNIIDNFWGILANSVFIEVAVHNVIRQNNFINNNLSIGFYCSIFAPYFKVDGNYYSDWHCKIPKLIWGNKILFVLFVGIGGIDVLIPWFIFDWHPAKKPYGIPGMS